MNAAFAGFWAHQWNAAPASWPPARNCALARRGDRIADWHPGAVRSTRGSSQDCPSAPATRSWSQRCSPVRQSGNQAVPERFPAVPRPFHAPVRWHGRLRSSQTSGAREDAARGAVTVQPTVGHERCSKGHSPRPGLLARGPSVTSVNAAITGWPCANTRSRNSMARPCGSVACPVGSSAAASSVSARLHRMRS
jgi:hypothetical protein